MHTLYLNENNSENQITIIESNKSRRQILKQIFREFSNIKISDNSISDNFDVTIMACSTSSGFTECLRLLKNKGKLILFSGFNDTMYKNENYLPEIIHRYEFRHFVQNKILIGSSGCTENDLMMSKSYCKLQKCFKKYYWKSIWIKF